MFRFLVMVTLVCFSQMGFADILPEHKITVQQKKIGLRDALTSLLQETDMKFGLSNNITNDKQITLEVQDITWSEAFKNVIHEAGLTYRVTSKNRILVSP